MIDRKLVPAVSFLEGVAVTLSGRAWPALVAALSVVIVALALIPGVALARYCGTIRVSGVSDHRTSKLGVLAATPPRR